MTGGPGHVTPEILADSAEGLLPAEQDAAVRSHLDDCSMCRRVAADLRDVTVLLAADPSPRMPDDVTARLEAALGAEPPLAAPSPAPSPSLAPSTRRWDRSRRRGFPVWIGAVAAIVLGGTVAVLGLRALDTDETSSSSTAGAPLEADRAAEAPEAALAAPSGGRAYTAASLDEQVLDLVKAGESGPAAADAASGREAAPGTVPNSGADESAGSSADIASALGALATPAGLEACIQTLAGRSGVTPVAVDLASFENRPAAIIVLPDSADASMLDVRVVGAGCSAADDDLIVATQVPRP